MPFARRGTVRHTSYTSHTRKTSPKLDLLRVLAKYYCLRTQDLAYLLKSDDPHDNDLRTINFTLKRLRDEGFVCRKQIIQNGRGDQRSFPFVYGLTDKGVSELNDGRSFEERRSVEHELALALFRIDLEDVCEKIGWELYWRQFDLKNRIDPDAYFRITTEAGGFHFFLEEERQKPSHKKQFRKWATYYDYYNSDLCQKEWGFRQFRVIIIEATQERAKHLLNTLATVPQHEPKCRWYPPRNGKCDCTPRLVNHRMFWVTSEDQEIGGNAFRHRLGRRERPRDHQRDRCRLRIFPRADAGPHLPLHGRRQDALLARFFTRRRFASFCAARRLWRACARAAINWPSIGKHIERNWLIGVEVDCMFYTFAGNPVNDAVH
jgi:hypothetical protein